MFNRKNIWLRTTAVFIIIASLLSTTVLAATPRASSYIKNTNVSISATGSGKVKITATVVGTGTMTRIGCKSIVVYESTDNSNWTWVASYYDSDYPAFMGTNKLSHTASVYHQGTAGRYYKATVTVYAGNSSGGGIDYPQTGSVKAK